MKLAISYLIVIPTTIFDKGASVELVENVRDVVKAAFSKAFGGYTEVRGLGGYSANDGRLIQERIYEIKAWAVDRNDSVVQEMARMVKIRLKQEAVFYQINQTAYIE